MFRDLWDVNKELVLRYHRGRVKPKRYDYLSRLWSYILNDEFDLVVLKAPTGIGKTEAVLTPFIAQYLGVTEPKWLSLVYVLPTKSLVSTMFKRISYEVLSMGLWGKLVVTLDYGDPALVKPYVEGDIVVTTYDALIYTLYSLRSWGRHYKLPLGKLVASLIVLDEVQLLQDISWFTPYVLVKHIRTLIDAGAKIILMTATIPDVLVKMIENEINTYNYRTECIEVFETALRGSLKVNIMDLRGLKESEAVFNELSNVVLSSIDSGYHRILCVFNTVRRATSFYEYMLSKVPNNLNMILLHSRLRRKVRRERESLLANANEGSGLILISTQVVEAGMDYNFDLIITELAPMDSLVQRLGRIARRVNTSGEAYIVIDDEGIEASKYVYGEFMSNALSILDSMQGIEELLATSVKSLSHASKLINNQYPEDLVNKVSKRNESLINKISTFIERFRNNVFRVSEGLRSRYNELQYYLSNLVRLGIEVKTVLPNEGGIIASKVSELINSNKNSLEIPVNSYDILENELFNNVVNLSIRGDRVLRPLILQCNEGDCIITINLVRGDSNKLKLVLNKILINNKRISKIMSPHLYYILNRSSYHFINGIDLGIIKITY